MTLTIVSGGQTGVDRGAFETAIRLGLDFGGWAPKGFRAEDGRIPEVYARRMRESEDAGYALRTRLNVQDSDATLILSWSSNPEKAGGGTWFTEKVCRQQGKQCVHLRLPRAGEEHPPEVQDGILKWLRLWNVHTLNVAGPRESKCPGIQAATIACLRWILEPIAEQQVRQLVKEMNLVEQVAASELFADPDPSFALVRPLDCRGEPLELDEVPSPVDSDAPARTFASVDRSVHPTSLQHVADPPPLTPDLFSECSKRLVAASDRANHGPPEGLDDLQRAQLDASIREAERDIRGTDVPDTFRPIDGVALIMKHGARSIEAARDAVEERVRAYHDLVATAPGPVGYGYHDEDDEPPAPGDQTA